MVPDEIRNYLLGYYGTPPGPVDQNVRDKVTKGQAAITERPGEVLEPMVEKFKAENGPFETDEALTLALFYSKPILRDWNLKDWNGYRNTPKDAFSYLIDSINRNHRISNFRLGNPQKSVHFSFDAK
ncbi:hypothetical protein D9M72_627110 [compost metagenome]